MIKELTVQTDHESLFAKFRKLSPKVTGGLVRMREEAYSDGKVPAKFKTLTAVAISVAIRCEPCIKAYVEQAVKQGATQDELVEFLNVAITMQGCPGEEWALKAFKFYREATQGASAPAAAGESCCHT